MSKPDIVIVPGLWEGPVCVEPCAQLLRSAGFATHIAPLKSTGQPYSTDPKSPGLHDDVAAARAVIEPVVESGKDVVLLLHSASGYIGSHAIQGLTKAARRTEGKKGGVVFIAFVTAGVLDVGASPRPLPFFDVQGPELWCKSPRTLLFNDVADDAQAQEYMALLRPQPSDGWFDTINYAGWKEVPSGYLICEVRFNPPSKSEGPCVVNPTPVRMEQG